MSEAPRNVDSSNVFSLQILQMECLTFRDKKVPREGRVSCQHTNVTGMETPETPVRGDISENKEM